MQIQSFRVKDLFNFFSYDFKIDPGQQIFLLTGPNGYGKTTVLTILSELARRNFYYFYLLPFQEIEIRFDTDDIIEIKVELLQESLEEDSSDKEMQPDKSVSFQWWKKDRLVSQFKVTNDIFQHYALRHMGGVRLKVLNHDSGMTELENNIDLQSLILEQQGASQFILFLKGLTIQILPTNRLVNLTEKSTERNMSTISYVAKKLEDLLNKYHYGYLQKVNRSNSSLFDKLLTNIVALSEDEYQSRAKRLSSKLMQLYEWGLCNEYSIREYQKEYANILTVYLCELESNIQVYEEVFSQLLLFKELLEKKRFVNKILKFSPSKGIEVRNKENLLEIDLNKLSSGEQHEIIMLYYAIFGVNKNSILLIDEPENSLHVAWQNHYLDDMELIANRMNIQMLIATHSPQIIGERWGDCYDLYEAMNNGKFDTACTSE